MKKLVSLLLAGCMALGLSGCSGNAANTETQTSAAEESKVEETQSAEALYTPGEYTATAQGLNSITLSVTFSEDKIEQIDIVEQSETESLGGVAMSEIIDEILEKQSLAIDAMSGATLTSDAVLAIVEDCVEQAGGDVSLLKTAADDGEADMTLTEMTADVIVVGSGAAGLSAATTVLEEGGSVIVVELMSTIGGTSAVSGGTLNAVDPARQEPLGIEDSVELFIDNVYESGGRLGNMDLISVFCTNATDARYWIEDHGGEWSGVIYQTLGGLWPRSMDAAVDTNHTIIMPLTQAIEDNGGQIIMNMEATDLIVEDSRVVGVNAVDTRTGAPYVFHAEKGVILATGGYARNKELLAEFNPDITEDIVVNPGACATGDGIVMAREIGANLVGMEYVQCIPGAPIYEDGSKGPSVHGSMENCVIVNSAGERVVNEYASRKDLTDACLAQDDNLLFFIFDGNTLTDDFVSQIDYGYTKENYKALSEEGLCGYGDTLEEACACLGLDAEAIQATIDDYNAMVRGEKEDEFGRDSFDQEIGIAPYVISIRVPKLHYTMGGVEIDTDSHVINTDGEIIEGLYAAGEVTGGIHGYNRVGGNALAECVVFGRIAGSNALSEK